MPWGGYPTQKDRKEAEMPGTFLEATLVVIEYGAGWPSWLAPTLYAQLALVAQHYETEPSSLVTQVASRLQRLEHRHWTLRTLVVVCNGRTDEAARSSRSVLARGLLCRLASRSGSELILSTDGRRNRTGRALSALLATLQADAMRLGVGLGLRLDGAPALIDGSEDLARTG